ncbi:PQQ-binding-like beta-propeller repeat protein, partial [Acidithiobacillus ferrooxidans]|nr:PQQ-binding-like beta-propeller repeat protein [Acidithiobacillus ferrooxidans]
MRFRFNIALATMIFSSLVASPAMAGVPVQWSVDVHAPIYNPPRVADGVVYFDTAQSKGPNVFSAKNGKILWRFMTGGTILMPLTVGHGQV